MEEQQHQKLAEEVGWALDGLVNERKKTEERLTYLRNRENELRNMAMSGQRANKVKAKPQPSAKARKRTISAEHRQKLSDAQRKRWATRKQSVAIPPSVVAAEATA